MRISRRRNHPHLGKPRNLDSPRPVFLARAREEAKSFTLNEGETKAVDLKLSTLQP